MLSRPKSNLRIKKLLKHSYLISRNLCSIIYGGILYKRTKETTASAHLAMIYFFCISAGKANDIISRIISKFNRKITLNDQSGILGDMSDKVFLNRTVKQLRKDGYVVFPSILSAKTCDDLMAFAGNMPSCPRVMDGEASKSNVEKVIFDGNHPAAIRYDYETVDLLQNTTIQDLLADGSIISVAQEYLECCPKADILSMWWHTNFSDKPDSEAAQFFHFDMDRFKWLKVFIYLTDVGLKNGPHVFIEGSHLTGAIPQELLEFGYARLDDEIIATKYPRQHIRSLVGARGTVIIEDTRGLHKGTCVEGEARLILQLQFSNCLFGANYPKVKIEQIKSDKLKFRTQQASCIYQQYL